MPPIPEPRIAPEDYKRLKRIDGSDHARALTFSCFRNQPFLRSDRAKGWFITAVLRALDRHRLHLWAWCVMPTHAHLLIFPTDPATGMAQVCATLKLSVSRQALAWVRSRAPTFLERMTHTTPGGRPAHRFWQRGGGYDRNLWSPRAIWSHIDYIHANPVQARLCARPEHYLWSSAAFYRTGQPGALPINQTRLPYRP